MRSVSEAARLVGVSTGSLRMWETQGLIAPARDRAGRRLYSDADVERLRKIAWWRRVRKLNAPAIRRIFEDEGGQPVAAVPAPVEESPLKDIRQLRHRSGLTLREVSERSGLSVSFLSAVERGISNASPTAAARIRAALQDSAAVDSQAYTQVHRLGTGKRVDVAPGITYEWLSAHSGLMEPQLVTVQPGVRSESTYSHEGEEFLVVLSGRLDLELSGDARVLKPRESTHFDSRVPHSWGNTSDMETEVLWVTTERGVWSDNRRRHGSRSGAVAPEELPSEEGES